MKNTIHNDLNLFNYFTSKDSFKITFLLLISLSIFGRLELPHELETLSAICFPFTIFFFHYTIILIFLYNTVMVCKLFDSEFDYIFIRYLSKKKKIHIIIKYVILTTLFCFVIFSIIYFGLIKFTYTNGNISINPYSNTKSIWLVYIYAKWMIILLLMQIFNALLYMIIKEKIVAIAFLYFIPLYLELFKKLKYNFFPWIHQTKMIWHSSIVDIISFSGCIVLFFIIIMILLKITERMS